MLLLLHTSPLPHTPFSPLSHTPLLSKRDGWILEWDSGVGNLPPASPVQVGTPWVLGPAGVRREGRGVHIS